MSYFNKFVIINTRCTSSRNKTIIAYNIIICTVSMHLMKFVYRWMRKLSSLNAHLTHGLHTSEHRIQIPLSRFIFCFEIIDCSRFANAKKYLHSGNKSHHPIRPIYLKQKNKMRHKKKVTSEIEQIIPLRLHLSPSCLYKKCTEFQWILK